MALKNRSQNLAAKFRVAVICPNCGSRCLVETSRRATEVTREYRVQCTNSLCSWSGVGVFEITKTISHPPEANKQNQLPPDVDKDYFNNPPPLLGELF